MRRAIVVVTAAWVVAGCYNYTAVPTIAPQPGAQLAFTLTESGSQELTRSLGADAFVVRGRYLGDSEQGALVAVSSVETKRGDQFPWAGETVTLPNNAIAGIEARRLAKGRSALLFGAGVTGLVATTAAFGLIGSGTRQGSTDTKPVKQ